ncbi:fimbrial protein [Morganella morganii]|uniref:fimbrial protein n=1 Tax=Morganella morganii TaxID=582 RepID=UPI0034D7AFF6
MKIKYAVLPTAIALLFSASSFADNTGKIFFTGSVKAPTCTVNNGAKNVYIDMGVHETGEFPAMYTMVQSDEKVILSLTECDGNTANLALTANERDGNDIIKLKDTANSAKGLGIVLVDSDTNTYRQVDGTVTSKAIVSREATFEFQPYLISLADVVTAGRINATVDYTITYN